MKNKNIFIVLLGFILVLLSSFVSAGELRVTQEHPFLIDNEWVSASELNIGDLLTTIEGKKVRIKSIRDVVSDKPFPVYNLEAGIYHDFVVNGGDGKGVVVHNSNQIVYPPSRHLDFYLLVEARKGPPVVHRPAEALLRELIEESDVKISLGRRLSNKGPIIWKINLFYKGEKLPVLATIYIDDLIEPGKIIVSVFPDVQPSLMTLGKGRSLGVGNKLMDEMMKIIKREMKIKGVKFTGKSEFSLSNEEVLYKAIPRYKAEGMTEKEAVLKAIKEDSLTGRGWMRNGWELDSAKSGIQEGKVIAYWSYVNDL